MKIPTGKKYTHFGELLRDLSGDYHHVKSGIIVMFDEDNTHILALATDAEMSYAAVRLMGKVNS